MLKILEKYILMIQIIYKYLYIIIANIYVNKLNIYYNKYLMNHSFISDENKSLIWNLVFESGGFNDIPESRIDNIKLMLDNKVSEIYNNNLSNIKSITELNKILLKSLYEDLKIYKVNENKTILARKEENVNEFNKKVENFRNQMNSILNVKLPEKPNFEDNNNINNLNDISESYDNLLKLREQEKSEIYSSQTLNSSELKIIDNLDKINDSKTSFLDFSTELYKIEENFSSSDDDNKLHVNLSNIKKISPSIKKSNDNHALTRRNSIDSNDSNDSILSINIDSIEYLDCNNNNTIICVNKNLEQIKKLEKITSDKKYLDERSDNNFNIHNKLNIIINKIDDLFEKYNSLELQVKTFTKENN